MGKDRLTADGDEPLFDDTLMEYGLIWQFKETKGLPFAADLAKFEARRDSLFGQDTGDRILTIGRKRRHELYPLNIPDTGFGIAR